MADRLFYERGYEHTSFKDITDAVQLARGNFYYDFIRMMVMNGPTIREHGCPAGLPAAGLKTPLST